MSGARLAELGLLLVALLAPLLPPVWAVGVLALVGALWLRSRPPRRERVAGILALTLGLLALAGGLLAQHFAGPPRAGRLDHERWQYARLWQGLQGDAAAGARALVAAPGSPLGALDPPAGQPAPGVAEIREATRAAFNRLNRLGPSGSGGRRALLLVDPVGNTVAWAGEGLIHEAAADAWPRSGLSYRAGFNAATLLAAEPLPDQSPGWRVVAGASYPTDALPRGPVCPALDRGVPRLAELGGCARAALAAALESIGPEQALVWSLADNAAQIHPGTLEIERLGAPSLVIAPLGKSVPAPWLGKIAWSVLALVLVAIAVLRGVGAALPEVSTIAGPRERRGWIALLALAAVCAVGRLAGVDNLPLAALLVGGTVAALGLVAPRRKGPGGRLGLRLCWLLGGATSGLLVVAAMLVQDRLGALDLVGEIGTSADGWALRLAWSAAAFGLFLLAGRHRTAGDAAGEGRAWGSLALLLLAAGLVGSPWLAVVLLVLGGAVAARTADAQPRRQGGLLTPLILLAALTGVASWQAAERFRLERAGAGDLLRRFARPAAADVAGLRAAVVAHFAAVDVESATPRAALGLETNDLAYALWRESPLAHPFALSAVLVQAGGSVTSAFSYGMAIGRDGLPERQRFIELPGWDRVAISGTVPLRLAGKPWGMLRFWFLPRPGFQAADAHRLVAVEAGLLRGGPALGQVEAIAAPALYSLYGADGRAVLSPWEQRPPLDTRLRGAPGETVRVATPSGSSLATVQPIGDAKSPLGWDAIYLPDEAFPEALENAGNWVVGLTLALALSAPLAMLLALPRASFRDVLWRTFHSYSRRLLILFTVLLLLPLLLLNYLLVRSVEQGVVSERSRAGEAALRSGQELLAKEIGGLEPGFVFDPATFDPEMGSIAAVVQHEVNLYWRSGLAASSKHELFTSGLLPKRIPGEIYAELALAGRSLGARVNHAADLPYLELYAPLRLAGPEVAREPQLFLSVPLLAQQEQSELELAHLRAHGVLVTVALFLLLAAVGNRLARNFTRPLMELVDGTRKIAAGATSLDLAPTELELAALVRAVDEMARRIAEGRERLLREKQVVERMVDSITAGVVSLDRERRVLMHNRVAAELLGVRVGQNVERVVRRERRLQPVATFLGSVGGEIARTTVRLAGSGGEDREWSLAWVPVPGTGEPFALLVVEDATEELRGQRLAAWAEMARMIAHEIKNPLTPIRLSAEHMREVYRSDPDHFGRVFEQCTTNILAQVEELRSIAADFSTYSAIPRIDPQLGDLTAAVAELVEGYRAAPPPGVEIGLETPGGAISTRFDGKLLMRAVRNLLENSIRATAAGGRVTVRVERADHAARIAVLDEGPGVPPELLSQIFDPYFSTHDSGTGLGLPIARRIVEEHGGTITAHNREEGGLEATVTLPA